MCEYDHLHSPASIAIMLMVASHTTTPGCFSCGEVIFAWNGKYSFSYHMPNGEKVIDYQETLRLYDSELEASLAMANFVWGLNDLLHKTGE